MKVLHVYKDYYPPVFGGIEGHINLLASCLKQKGIDTEILVSNTRPRYEQEDINGIKVIKVPEVGRFASAPLNPTLPFVLSRLARQAQIVHFHFPNPTAEMSYLLSRTNKKVIVSYHSDIVRQAKLGKLYYPFMRKFLSRSHTILVSSPNYLRSSPVLRQFWNKCKVVPYGIDLERFAPSAQMASHAPALRRVYGPSIILFIGRFRYYKGLQVLIEAMSMVDGKLLLIGSGFLEKDLRLQVGAAGLDNKVLFLGNISDHEAIAYFQACDVFVLPSVLRSEAFGIVQLEAMACGKPVISTELGTGTSFVNQHQKTGLVVPPNDVAALAQAINYLLANPRIRDEYGRAGQERVKRHFSKERMIDSIIAVYQE